MRAGRRATFVVTRHLLHSAMPTLAPMSPPGKRFQRPGRFPGGIRRCGARLAASWCTGPCSPTGHPARHRCRPGPCSICRWAPRWSCRRPTARPVPPWRPSAAPRSPRPVCATPPPWRRGCPPGRRGDGRPVRQRWPDGSLRPALEDLLGAGAVIAGLSGPRSPEADAAAEVWRACADRLPDVLAACSSGREQVERGWADDLRFASEVNASSCVPVSSTARSSTPRPDRRHRRAGVMRHRRPWSSGA